MGIFKKVSDAFRQMAKDKTDIKNYDKGVNDKFTDLDWLIQKVMEKYCKKYIPGLLFIGEEDTTIDIDIGDKYSYLTNDEELDLNLLKEDLFEDKEYLISDLKLFIDPIDATMCFIKKNYQVVTCLVGITYKNKAHCGLVHYPFEGGEINDKSVTYMNIPNKGIFTHHTYQNELVKVNTKEYENKVLGFTRSRTKTTNKIKKIHQNFKNPRMEEDDGLGNKLIAVLKKDLIMVSTGKLVGYWDVCAGHAICKETGGGCFDNDGNELEYPMNDRQFINKFIFISSTKAKTEEFLEDSQIKVIENEDDEDKKN